MSAMYDRGRLIHSLSERVGVLSHPYRRRIRISFDTGNPREEDELTPEVIAEDSDELDVLELSPYHDHFAKFAESGYMAGAIEFLREREGDEVFPVS